MSTCSAAVVVLMIVSSACVWPINHIRNENSINNVNIQQFYSRFRDINGLCY